jgi:hypothetical protein
MLQTAAVIGPEVPLPLLCAILAVPAEALADSLAHLQSGEFLHKTRILPTPTYTFALTFVGYIHQSRREWPATQTYEVDLELRERAAKGPEGNFAYPELQETLDNVARHTQRLREDRTIAAELQREFTPVLSQLVEELKVLTEQGYLYKDTARFISKFVEVFDYIVFRTKIQPVIESFRLDIDTTSNSRIYKKVKEYLNVEDKKTYEIGFTIYGSKVTIDDIYHGRDPALELGGHVVINASRAMAQPQDAVAVGRGRAPASSTLAFDGQDDHGHLAHHTALDLTNNSTIEAWVNPASVTRRRSSWIHISDRADFPPPSRPPSNSTVAGRRSASLSPSHRKAWPT